MARRVRKAPENVEKVFKKILNCRILKMSEPTAQGFAQVIAHHLLLTTKKIFS